MPHRGVTPIYVFRPNRRRRTLNWNEATLLDAARSFGGCDCNSWDDAMERLVSLTVRLLPGESIAKDKVMWAAITERFHPKWPAGTGNQSFDAVIDRLRVDMPDSIDL